MGTDALWRLVLCLPVFLTHLNYTVSDEIHHTNSQKCSHLKTVPGQYNMYIKDKLICCMCSAGHRWAGDCSQSDPNTTLCEKCHFNPADPSDRYVIPFEPHMQKQCYLQNQPVCFDPQVLFEGSTTEEAECRCPDGMEKASYPQLCVNRSSPASTIIVTKLIQSTIAQKGLAKSTSKSHNLHTSTTVPTIVSTEASKILKTTVPSAKITTFEDLPVLLDASTQSEVKTTVKSPEDEKVSKSDHDYLNWLIPTVVIVLLLLFCWCWYRRCIRNECAQKSGKTPDDSPTTSSLHLLKDRNACDEYVVDILSGNESPPAANKAVPMRDRRPLEQHHPLLGGGGDEIPEIDLHPRVVMDPKIREITKLWKPEIRPCNIREVFRGILDNEYENDIIDIVEKKFHGNTREQIQQLMDTAHRILGNDLTPQYLLEKLRDVGGYRNLEDIVSTVMRQP